MSWANWHCPSGAEHPIDEFQNLQARFPFFSFALISLRALNSFSGIFCLVFGDPASTLILFPGGPPPRFGGP